MMRSAIGRIVGRRCDAVFLVPHPERTEIYLHFDDDTYIEIYGNMQCYNDLRGATLETLRGDFARYPYAVEYPPRT